MGKCQKCHNGPCGCLPILHNSNFSGTWTLDGEAFGYSNIQSGGATGPTFQGPTTVPTFTVTITPTSNPNFYTIISSDDQQTLSPMLGVVSPQYDACGRITGYELEINGPLLNYNVTLNQYVVQVFMRTLKPVAWDMYGTPIRMTSTGQLMVDVSINNTELYGVARGTWTRQA